MNVLKPIEGSGRSTLESLHALSIEALKDMPKSSSLTSEGVWNYCQSVWCGE